MSGLTEARKRARKTAGKATAKAEQAGATPYPDEPTPDSGYPSSEPPAAGGPSNDELELLAGGAHPNPHGVLGIHPVNNGVVMRALRTLKDTVPATAWIVGEAEAA